MTAIRLRIKEIHRVTFSFEQVGGFHLAHSVPLTQIQIYFDSHRNHLQSSWHYLERLRYLTLQGCASCTTIFEWSFLYDSDGWAISNS